MLSRQANPLQVLVNILCFYLPPNSSNIRQCDGSITEHDSHDVLFGGRRVYLACCGLWLASLMALLPDIMGVCFKNFSVKYFTPKFFRLQVNFCGLAVPMDVTMITSQASAPILVPSSTMSSISVQWWHSTPSSSSR